MMPRTIARRLGDRCFTRGNRSHKDNRCIMSGTAMFDATLMWG